MAVTPKGKGKAAVLEISVGDAVKALQQFTNSEGSKYNRVISVIRDPKDASKIIGLHMAETSPK